MVDVWYTFLSMLCARAYFARIRVIGPEHLPPRGPVLYIGLHRNGAVDGFVYKSICRRAIFLIAAQLQNNVLSRIFFTGIPVVREKDSGDRGMNSEAMERCAELLAAGGDLFIFPEGSSSLGPRHLPFKSGAARIAVAAFQTGVPLTVVPLGITYDAPAKFRSSVEVIVGDAITAEELAPASEGERIVEAKRAISQALENVGLNAESTERFEELRMIAKVASLGGSHFHAMKRCEKGIPERLQAPWTKLREALRATSNLKRSEAAAAFMPTSPWISLFAGVLLAPFVALAAALNFVPLTAAYWAGKKFPDGPNVITLWRILIGAPLFFLWFVFLLMGLTITGRSVWFLSFILLTLIGWVAYYPMRQYLVAGWNGIRLPRLRWQYLEFQGLLLAELAKHET